MRNILGIVLLTSIVILGACKKDEEGLDKDKLAAEELMIEDYVADNLPDAIKLDKGVYISTIIEGDENGLVPEKDDFVNVKFEGTIIDEEGVLAGDDSEYYSSNLGVLGGTTFIVSSSSYRYDSRYVPEGWVIGLQAMKSGGKYILVLPSKVVNKDYVTHYLKINLDIVYPQ